MTTGAGPPGGVIAWFVRNPVASNLMLAGIFVSGLLVVRDLPQETIPAPNPSWLTIRTALPGASAAEIEESVLVPLEETVREVTGVEETSALAFAGAGVLTVEVAPWADFTRVSDEVRARVAAITTLPDEAEDPVIGEQQPDELLLRLGVHGKTDEHSLREAAEAVRERVLALPGIAKVDVLTGRAPEIAIEVAEATLSRFELDLGGLAAAIRRGSAAVPAGVVRANGQEVLVRTGAEAVGADDFARIPVIVSPGGGVVRLGDLAAVTDGFADTGQSAFMNGEPAVLLAVYFAPGTRLLDAARAVHDAIAEPGLPEGITVAPWRDTWRLFVSRMEVLVRNGIAGVILIFLVLYPTTTSRLAVWTAAGLPVGFFGCFLLMPGLGVSVNMISLFGFILTLGIVVDDAIVVGENVDRRVGAWRRPGASDAGAIARIEAAAVRGAREVLVPAAFGVLTTMAAFAPLLGLPGQWGDIMGNLPLIVIPVLAFSLVEAAWILPHHLVHGGLRLRPSPRITLVRAVVASKLIQVRDRLYRPALAWSLENRLAALALAVCSLALAAGLVRGGWIPVETTPPLESNTVTVQVSLPPGSTGDATLRVLNRLAGEAERFREETVAALGIDPVRHVVLLTGQQLPLSPGGLLPGAGSGQSAAVGQLQVELVQPEERPGVTVRALAVRLRQLSGEFPAGTNVSVVVSLMGEEADLSIRIAGPDPETLRDAAVRYQEALAGYTGVIGVRNDFEGGAPGIVARLSPGGAGAGISAGALGQKLRQALHGEEITRIQRGRDEVRVLLRYPDADRRRLETIRDMRAPRPGGGLTPIGRVADLSAEPEETTIRLVDGQRAVHVHADVDRAVASPGVLLAEVRSRLLPDLREEFPDLSFEVAGLAGEQQQTVDALARNLLLALMLIYVLLAVPLGSWVQPLVILSAVPFGLAGAVFGHLLLGLELSLISFFGMAALTGVVVNDALVLLHHINRQRRAGSALRDAVLNAGPRRFRPVILTSVTTCAGLLPLLAERSLQAQFLIPMAASLAFGVIFATLVTLLVVPTIYSVLFERSGARRLGVSG